ncbi:hypothetical protein K7X08_018071 [Anisodus acutangulus]|uniref:Pentatricopeptide repeat-containing protein n=1 Tax=Anisodus acutangulus TaxID=402998 RepID=A0A9Q1R8K2_9SOLA|nr:hypothetical protein K7X08_018071 [Anisodus acutangulus]
MGSKIPIKWPREVTAAFVEQLSRAEKDVQKAVLIFDAATSEYSNGFRHDRSTFGLMISRLLSANHFKLAEEMLVRMKDESSLCKNSGTIDSAVRIFHEIPKRGFTPDSYTYGTLINGLCRLGKATEAKELLMEMEANGCLPTVVTYTCLICGFCQSNNLDGAMGLLEDMRSKGIEPNVFTYSSLMDGLCKGGRSSEAMELLEIMIHEHKIHNAVVRGLCVVNDPKRAFQLYLSMRTRAISVEAKSFEILVNHFCKKGDVHNAARIVEEMLTDGCHPDEQTWAVVVGGFWDRRKVREAADSVQADLMCKRMDLGT